MEALFTHPLTMIAGGALVSAPIIIHLINRMRFRRVKWAAMEFLLKAQKRMRRKLIIEQLILLMLRCLLVLLVGVLLARFKWFGSLEGEETRATAHVVVIDDSPSVGEVFTSEGKATTALEQAKTQIAGKIAPAAGQANTPQSMDLLLLSDLRQANPDVSAAKTQPTVPKPRSYDRLNESATREMQAFLAPLQPSPVRVSLVEGLRTAKELLDRKPDAQVAKVIHIVSDLRAVDWSEDGETLRQLLTELTAGGVRVHLIDVAYPYRKENDRQPRSGDNVGIVEFRPKARTVSRRQPIEFDLRVRNSGSAELKDVRVEFFLNGRRWPEASARIASLPPNQERTETVTVPTGIDRVATKDNPLDRFSLITARLADQEPGGLREDNARHTVIEVLEQLPVLVIEGRQKYRDQPTGDAYFLKQLLGNTELGTVKVVEGREADLEKQDLHEYAGIYLMNVPALTEAQRDKLESYVRGGGGVGIFLGPDVKQADYNKLLYRGGEGLFPFPLNKIAPRPSEEARFKRNLILSKKVLVRDAAAKSHPALAGIYNESGVPGKPKDVERQFFFVNIDQYWEVLRLGAWQTDKSIRELYCLPNEKSPTDFAEAVNTLLGKLRPKIAEPKFEKYRPYVAPLDAKMVRAVQLGSEEPLSALVLQLDRLLCDQINDGDESEPILREFWGQPEMTDLRGEFQRLRDTTKFGDPLYVARQFGQGRVAVMTTDAGGAYREGAEDVRWNNWPTGDGYGGWVMVVGEMHKYLAGGAADGNRTVGSSLRLALDPAVYQRKSGETRPVDRVFLSADPFKAERSGDLPFVRKELGQQPLQTEGTGGPVFDFTETREPGVYVFTQTQFTGPDGEGEKPVYSAYAFNIDAQREGDLIRVSRDDLEQLAPKVPVHSADDTGWMTALKQKQDDFSTRRWLYLFILLVLVAEQAMAVRLSFHTRPEDLDLHAPSAAAAFAHGTPIAAPVAAEEPAGV